MSETAVADTSASILQRMPELVCLKCQADLAAQDDGLRCAACGRVYPTDAGIPTMLGEEMSRFAEEIAVQDRVALEYESKRYKDEYAQRYHAWWTDRMTSKVSLDGRILDNGCGLGLLAEQISADRLVGLDISSEMLTRARQTYDNLVLGNSQELPFRDGSFDVAFCRSLLHHLPEPETAVREMHRVLRPNGQIVLADTNASLLSTLPRRIAYSGDHFSDDHKNLNRRMLEGYLTPHFTIDEIEYFGYIAYPLMGFPDMVRVFRFVPFKPIAARALMATDAVLSNIPLIRTQSWGIFIKATRKA